MKNMPDDQVMASYLSGECTAEQLREMEQWLQSHPEYQPLMDGWRKAWSPLQKRPNVWDKQQLWLSIRDAAGVQQAPISAIRKVTLTSYLCKPRVLMVAASALLVVSIAYFSYAVISNYLVHHQDSVELIVQNGTQEELTLSDGTVVILDAGSSFSYPARFTTETREVSLYGEGYFNVAPDGSRPFMVHADHAVIQVLGTTFSVRSWRFDRAVRVTVAEGKVSLRSEGGQPHDAVVVADGQAAAVMEDGRIQPPHSVDIDRHLGWLKHEIRFDDNSLEEILFHLERWYDVKFHLMDADMASERLTIRTQKKSIDSILEMITLLTDLKVEHSGKTIRLFSS